VSLLPLTVAPVMRGIAIPPAFFGTRQN
jgi:hypothetical protein